MKLYNFYKRMDLQVNLKRSYREQIGIALTQPELLLVAVCFEWSSTSRLFPLLCCHLCN